MTNLFLYQIDFSYHCLWVCGCVGAVVAAIKSTHIIFCFRWPFIPKPKRLKHYITTCLLFLFINKQKKIFSINFLLVCYPWMRNFLFFIEFMIKFFVFVDVYFCSFLNQCYGPSYFVRGIDNPAPYIHSFPFLEI
jgi:hypothetical protein